MHPSVRLLTLSNMNISEPSGPIEIKFYLKHQFNEGILLAWKANLDIQIVLEPYGCASHIVGYININLYK